MTRLHPGLRASKSKELFFFNEDRTYARGLDWYVSQFEQSPRASALVDVCHEYLFDSRAAARISAHFPDAKFFAVLRNPGSRAYSSYRYMQFQGRIGKTVTFREAYEQVPELVYHGRYYAHLRPFLDTFPREQLELFTFEDFFADPLKSTNALLNFIGAAPLPDLPAELRAPVRPSPTARNAPLVATGRRALGFLRDVGAHNIATTLKESAAVQRLATTSAEGQVRARDDEAVIATILRQLRPDIDRLAQTMGVDLAHKWGAPPD